MERTCPKCEQQLPEVDELQYRFCPHCGAEIDVEPRPLDEAYLTIPPDLTPQQVENSPGDVNSEAEKKLTAPEPFKDHTIAPQSVTPQNRPELRPPAEPPPASFFRTPISEPEPPPPIPQKQRTEKVHASPPKSSKKPAAKNHQKVIIAALIILALLILILGGMFTF